MEETSLTDFLGDEPDAGDGSGGDEAGGDESPASEAVAVPDRPAVTAAYRPAGATCERCEATVAWRWTDGEERVCRDCKDW